MQKFLLFTLVGLCFGQYLPSPGTRNPKSTTQITKSNSAEPVKLDRGHYVDWDHVRTRGNHTFLPTDIDAASHPGISYYSQDQILRALEYWEENDGKFVVVTSMSLEKDGEIVRGIWLTHHSTFLESL